MQDKGSYQPVRINAAGATIDGDLDVPGGASGLVIFAHGSGSSRFSVRNRQVADALGAAGFGTLLLDLLTPGEEAVDERTRQHRFDVALLGRRVVSAIDAMSARPDVHHLPIGLFGASTGAAAALIAAAERPDRVHAVISRGGRPDLAADSLPHVHAPTLLIVGGFDEPVIALNKEAMRRMRVPATLEIIPRATHLFEEPGALDQVAALATSWCRAHLAAEVL